MRPTLKLSFVALALAGTGWATAGVVNVSYVNPSHFVDAGNSAGDERENLNALARHLQNLGRTLLPANETLRLEVLDVDLAGTVHDSPRTGARIRTVRGGADWPRVSLRYTLEVDGRPVQKGEEWVSDLNYAQGISSYRTSQPLYYEKRMLEDWFRQRFTGDAQAQAQARSRQSP